MSRQASINIMIQQIHALHGTDDLTEWETDFTDSVWRWSERGTNVSSLTEKQLDHIERIWSRHFA